MNFIFKVRFLVCFILYLLCWSKSYGTKSFYEYPWNLNQQLQFIGSTFLRHSILLRCKKEKFQCQNFLLKWNPEVLKFFKIDFLLLLLSGPRLGCANNVSMLEPGKSLALWPCQVKHFFFSFKMFKNSFDLANNQFWFLQKSKNLKQRPKTN